MQKLDKDKKQTDKILYTFFGSGVTMYYNCDNGWAYV